ncbi:hypothetical protein HF319_00115 [Xanthomonas sp. Kuri4-1]
MLAALQTGGIQQARAQTTNLLYEKLIAPSSMEINSISIGAGEQLDLPTGHLTLTATDIAVPGNSAILVELRRTMDNGIVGTRESVAPLGGWVLDLPRISVSHAKNIGWATRDTSRPYKNCSIAQVGYLGSADGTKVPENKFYPFTYWSPPTLHIPGGGGALLYDNAGMPAPTGGQGQIFWRTTDHAVASCLTNVANPTTGLGNNAGYDATEGYLVTTASGLKYRFDWVATDYSREVSTRYAPTGYPAGTTLLALMNVQEASLYVTRIEDRFGNYVIYKYSNAATATVKLDSVTASDGRTINLTYDSGGYLTGASSGGRTWRYTYSGTPLYRDLTAVQLPDGSQWTYSGRGIRPSLMTDPYYGSCINQTTWSGEQTTDTIDSGDYSHTNSMVVGAPSGLKTTYVFLTHLFGKSAVPKNCYASGWISSPFFGMVQEPVLPVWFAATSLASKTVSGPGMTNATWRYGYISRHGFLPMTDGYTRTRVLNPDGSLDTYLYGNTFDQNEGLLRSMSKSKDGVELSRTDYTYELGGSNSAYPKRIGTYNAVIDSGYVSTFLRPMVKQVRTESGIPYIWMIPQDCSGQTCLETFGRPTRITTSSLGN